MIFPYKYLNRHSIESLHVQVMTFFYEMHYNAGKRFNQSLLQAEFLALAKRKPDIILDPLKKIYQEYKKLNGTDQNRIISAYTINNSIADLCSGRKQPFHYTVLNSISPKLSSLVKTFFANLYEEIINKELAIAKTDHFTKFRTLNQTIIICPFCGLDPLLGRFDAKDNKKDDYDHWLSKGKYPFNSINFRNLVPMCGNCNKKYKGQKDTLFNKVGKTWQRRLVFYPYSGTFKSDTLKISIDRRVASLEKDDNWNIAITSNFPKYAIEVQSWNKIFSIQSRYKNRIRERYQLTWYENIKKLYKQKRGTAGFSFNNFKKEIYNGVPAYNLRESAILEKAYYDYFFADPNCQRNLDAVI